MASTGVRLVTVDAVDQFLDALAGVTDPETKRKIIGREFIRSFENAAEALRHLQQGIEFDLLLSDIVMPGSIDGLGLAEICQERFPDIPVLLTSGYSDAAQAADGRFDILRKPFELSALERAIELTAERGRPGWPKP